MFWINHHLILLQGRHLTVQLLLGGIREMTRVYAEEPEGAGRPKIVVYVVDPEGGGGTPAAATDEHEPGLSASPAQNEM